MHIYLLAMVSFGRYRCDYVDLISMPLDVKVLFGNLSLVRAPAFHLELKHFQMAGLSHGYPSTLLKWRLQFRLQKLSSIILQKLTETSKKTKRCWTWMS